ncbi:MAG: hypothetical protein Q4F83_04955 [Eubacteriales bacterium]|nr:hypothetical protein [Eubacteriales bacterium]
MGKYYHYFVEGQDEEKLINVLKTDMQYIVPGKVQKFNVVQEKLTSLRLMQLKKGTIVVLVFDTDSGNIQILQENIELLKKSGIVKTVLCVTQVKNLEDELVRSCNIRQIKELTGSKSNKDFKHDLIKDSHFCKKLEIYKFDLKKFWNMTDKGTYSKIKNDADKIKLKQ